MEFIHSGDVNLHVCPEAADYERKQSLGACWQRWIPQSGRPPALACKPRKAHPTKKEDDAYGCPGRRPWRPGRASWPSGAPQRWAGIQSARA
jgi:hypothetical protein